MNQLKISALAALALTMASCGSSEADSQSSEAAQLLDQATLCMQQADYDGCLTLLDSVAKNYKTDTAAIRRVINMRPAAIEKLSQVEMVGNDSLIALEEVRVGELRKAMREVKLPNAGSYFVANKAYDPNFITSTGISARTDEYGFFYIVSALNGPDIKYTSVGLKSATASANTPEVALDNARNYSREGARIVTFTTSESKPLGELVAANPTESFTLEFNGVSPKSVKLSKEQVEAVAQTFAYSQAVDSLRKAYLNRERLQRRLEVAKQQQEQHKNGQNK